MTRRNPSGKAGRTGPATPAVTTPRSRTRGWLLAGYVILTAVGIAEYGHDVLLQRQAALHQAKRDAARSAALLAELTARTFESVDRAIAAAIGVYRDMGKGEIRASEAHAFLQSLQSSSPAMRSLILVNAAGDVVYSSTSATPPSVNVADRHYFGVHARNEAPGAFINDPVHSRVLGAKVIHVSRRLAGRDGGFDGVVMAHVAREYFASVFAVAALDHGGPIVLARDTGTILARHPADDALGTMVQRSADDPGQGRLLTSWQPVPGQPLVIGVSIDRETALAAWRAGLRTEMPTFVAVFLAVVVLALLLVMEFRRGDEYARALERSHAAADAANRGKSEFLAQMSHELRTPLNAIIGFSEMLQGQYFGALGSDRNREYVTDIRDSGKHLLGLVNNLLDLSKVQAGKWKLREALVSPGLVVAEVASLLRPFAEAGGVTLVVEPAERLPALWADESLVRQIVINLVNNAIKFTPAGGCVTVGAAVRTGGLVLRVSDTGIGIAPHDIPRVLEPFELADASTPREGTGLGLPLCKAFAELHGGRLLLESKDGRGTVVTVVFPADRIRATPPPQSGDDRADDRADARAAS